jgi:hypothetical protein
MFLCSQEYQKWARSIWPPQMEPNHCFSNRLGGTRSEGRFAALVDRRVGSGNNRLDKVFPPTAMFP